MTKINLSFAALATAAMLVAAPAFAEKANAPAIGPSHIQLAQADVKVRVSPTGKRTVVKKKVIVKRPVKKKVIVRTPGVVVASPAVRSRTVVTTPRRTCRVKTVRKTVNGKVIVRKVRSC
jgi:hypothetical protein